MLSCGFNFISTFDEILITTTQQISKIILKLRSRDGWEVFLTGKVGVRNFEPGLKSCSVSI